MRHAGRSSRIQITFIFSILLHICMVFLIYNPINIAVPEKTPISIELVPPPISMPDVTEAKPVPEKKGVIEKQRTGRPGADIPEIKQKMPDEKSISHAATTTKSAPFTDIPDTVPEKGDLQLPHSVENSESRLPGIQDLTPALDKLARLGKQDDGVGEGGASGKDEESVYIDSSDIRFTSYLHGVRIKVEGIMKYPDAARRSAIQGRGYISFTIRKDGTVEDLKLLDSSGYPILDQDILNTIRNAAPFNPFAKNMKLNKLNVTAMFEYSFIYQRLWGRRQ